MVCICEGHLIEKFSHWKHQTKRDRIRIGHRLKEFRNEIWSWIMIKMVVAIYEFYVYFHSFSAWLLARCMYVCAWLVEFICTRMQANIGKCLFERNNYAGYAFFVEMNMNGLCVEETPHRENLTLEIKSKVDKLRQNRENNERNCFFLSQNFFGFFWIIQWLE